MQRAMVMGSCRFSTLQHAQGQRVVGMQQQQIATQQQQLNHVQGLGLRLMEVLGRGHATIADLEVQLHKMMPPGPLRPDLAHSLPQQ